MGIFFIDGFDAYTDFGNTQTGAATRWSQNWWTYIVDGGLHPGGGRHLALNAEPGHGRVMFPFTPTSTVSFGFTFQTTKLLLSVGDNALAMLVSMNGQPFNEGTQGQIKICIVSNGALRIMLGASSWNGGTILAESAAGVVINGMVQNLEVEAVIAPSGRVTAWLDGIQVATFNGNTQLLATSFIDCLRIGGGTTYEGNAINVDDFWISNAATKPANGPFRVQILRPNADGATKAFAPSTGTSNFAMVNEALADLSTYVQSNAAGAVDEYGLEDLAEVPNAIAAVQAVAFAKKTDAGARTFAIGVKSGSTIEDGPTFGLLTSSTKLVHVMEADPATNAAWTFLGVNALQLRPKVIS